MQKIHIIGGGLAGSECAWQIAKREIPVVIHELRNEGRYSEAHKTDMLAELVCSNSFRSDDKLSSAIGLLHEEMREMDSLIMQAADLHKVPAGGALAVDREAFSKEVENRLRNHPMVEIKREEITYLPGADFGLTIIATGPLTSQALSKAIIEHTGEEHLAFFDAIAPIIYRDSVDFSKAWFQSRYDKPGPAGSGKDYINCPMDQEEYENFVQALIAGEKTEFKDWEKNTPYFEGCLPIEVMAERGIKTLAFGPMKPVGLTCPYFVNNGKKLYAVVQLRQDNKLGTLYNMVGFQTKLKYGAQGKIFKLIPGLENAEFARFGGIHRNSFIKSPKLLDQYLRLKTMQHIRFAGQITGVEGYVESAATGLLAGLFAAYEYHGKHITTPPFTTALGSLLNHITAGANLATFQPMNINFGLMPEFDQRIPKGERKAAYCTRALADLKSWQKEVG